MRFIFCCFFTFFVTSVDAQYTENTYIKFVSKTENSYLNNGKYTDTVFFSVFPDKNFIYSDNIKKNKKTIIYEFDKDLYQYTFKNNQIISEKVYTENQNKLFREKTYFYKKDILHKIKIYFNVCCDNEETLPADYVYFVYDVNGKLTYAVAVIDKNNTHKDEKSIFGNEINRDNFSISNVYKLEYGNNGITVFRYILKDKALKTRNINKLNKLCDINFHYKIQFNSDDHKLLQDKIIDILFPKIYLALYGYNGFYVIN